MVNSGPGRLDQGHTRDLGVGESKEGLVDSGFSLLNEVTSLHDAKGVVEVLRDVMYNHEQSSC